MGTVTVIKKARKEHKCSKCGRIIEAGSLYYRGELNFSKPIIRCDACKLESWEVTTSDYIRSAGALMYHWKDNFDDMESAADDIVDELETIRDELEDKLYNMPESLQDSDTGMLIQERIDNVDEAISELENIDIDAIHEEAVNTFISESGYSVVEGDTDWDSLCSTFDADDPNCVNLYHISEDLISEAIDEALSNLEV